MSTQNPTGYGPRRTPFFDGNEAKYELWEVKFLGYMRLQKLYKVFVPGTEDPAPDEAKNADAFAELVQCLDDRSLSLVIREAKNDGRKALTILQEHYQGKGKPRIIALYTELTSLKMKEKESTIDYIIRAETAATALKAAEEVISDGLLIAMVLKGLSSNYKTFCTVVIQKENQMSFADFKTALRNFEETEKCSNRGEETKENVMSAKQRFSGKCFNCNKNGHKSVDCRVKSQKWCERCKAKSHDTKDCRFNKDSVKSAVNQENTEHFEHSHSFAFNVTDKINHISRGKIFPSLLLDTGATSHIINDKSKFVNFDENFDPKSHLIELADGSRANVVVGKGKAKVKLYDVKGNLQDVILNNALYIPSYKQNIFSVPAAVEKGVTLSISKHVQQLEVPNGSVFNIEQKGRLYFLNSISSSKNNASSLMEWHRIMGHCNMGDLRKLEAVVDGMKITNFDKCDCNICIQGKMCQFRSREPDEKAKSPLEFVHCDLAGPIDPVARDGYRYALSLVDDYTGLITVYFLKHKSDTVEATEKFLADTAPFGKVKRIRSDNGTEFTSQTFRSLLQKHSIKHETSAPYSPHQNGTVERAWRSLFSMARCLLLEAKLPKNMWTYAVMASAYIRNRCFNTRLGKTPIEGLTGKRPNLANMHVFGSTCYAYVQDCKKLDARSSKGIFVGYDRQSPAYLVYYPESNKIQRVRCVKFCEFDSKLEEAVLSDNQDDEFVPIPTPVVVDEQDENSVVENQPNNARYPTRVRSKPKYLDEYVLSNDTGDNVNYTTDYCYRVANIPASYEQAIRSNEASKWQKAMDDEIEALDENETFELVRPPKDRQIVGGRWVFAVKTGPNGEESHKARYVAKGYSQVAEIDYKETFAPTARMSSIRMLVQLAVQNDMVTHQMDVKTAYLNAPIDCDIYMEQPEGFQKTGENGERLVCKLKKSLYGLKQSGRNWNNVLHNFLLDEKFTQSLADPCVYVRKLEEQCIIIIIWVDDIIISASNTELLTNVKEKLCSKFKMKDIGKLSWFLGTHFKSYENCIEMTQTQYIDTILSKFGMTDCKPKSTPCNLGIEKESEFGSNELVDPKLYRAMAV